jgi:hypothetical protein
MYVEIHVNIVNEYSNILLSLDNIDKVKFVYVQICCRTVNKPPKFIAWTNMHSTIPFFGGQKISILNYVPCLFRIKETMKYSQTLLKNQNISG